MVLLRRKLKTLSRLLSRGGGGIPLAIFNNMVHLGLFDWISDEKFLKLAFMVNIHAPLRLETPKTFNEKLQWLKIYDRNPIYTRMVDKIDVKEWVAQSIGEEHVVPTLACWDSVETIDVSSLPNRFVLKTNHDSGSVVVCNDKTRFDIEGAKAALGRALSRNLYYATREWPYKGVVPRIFAESHLADFYCVDAVPKKNSGVMMDIPDYKFMCFDGTVKSIFTCTNRFEGDLRVDFFDREWNHMPFTRRYPNADRVPLRPKRLSEMICLAESLSKGIPFVRVDFYEIGSRVFFGEMTFYPGSGFERFEPIEWDYTLGSWLTLPSA